MMAIMEGFGSVNNVFQCGGRIFRIGQTLAQKIWQVTLDQSYDEKIQYRATIKMIGQIAAQNLDLELDHDIDNDEANAVIDMSEQNTDSNPS